MSRFTKALCASTAVAALSGISYGGVVVSLNTDASAWPGTPAVNTYDVPNRPVLASSIVGENFAGNGIATTGRGVSQTFSPTSTFQLGSLKILASGAGGGDPHTLHLFDVTGIAANQSSYAPGSLNGGIDLFAGLSFTAPGANNGLVSFDFDGVHQVTLLAGKRYAFEIWGPATATASGPMTWARGGGAISTYAGGDGYEGTVTRDDNLNGAFAPADLLEVRTQFAGQSRDAVLGVYAVPEPTALSLLGVGAAGLLRRRRA